jgi:hypothetical protein
MPPRQAHILVIEIPNSPEIQPEDIDRNRARLSRSPATELQMPPKRFQRRDNAATLANNRTVTPASIDRELFPNIAGIAQAWRDGDRQKAMPPWITLSSRAT